MFHLPNELIHQIYLFDSTYHLLYKKCISELNKLIHIKQKQKEINQSIHYLRFGPVYGVPRYFLSHIQLYKLFNIIRKNNS